MIFTYQKITTEPPAHDHSNGNRHSCRSKYVAHDSRHGREESTISRAIDNHECDQWTDRVGYWPEYEETQCTKQQGQEQCVQRAKLITGKAASQTTNCGRKVEGRYQTSTSTGRQTERVGVEGEEEGRNEERECADCTCKPEDSEANITEEAPRQFISKSVDGRYWMGICTIQSSLLAEWAPVP